MVVESASNVLTPSYEQYVQADEVAREVAHEFIRKMS